MGQITPFWKRLDWWLIIMILPFIGISLFLISEISYKLYLKELFYIGVGIGAFIFLLFIPIRKLLWVIPFLYWFNVLLLVLVDLVGVRKLGARRWLEIPFTPFTIQPSEFMKTTLLLMLGYMIYRYPPRPVYTIKEFFYLSIFIIIPFLLIAKEPDLGTALITLIVGFGVLFIIGVDKRVWIGVAVAAAIAIPVGYKYLLKDYQRKRIETFLNKPTYHVKQSIIAIGSGGLIGKSREGATQTQLKFLPIASSDFIFAYLAERFGFIGASGVILLYFLLIIYLLTKAEQLKEDYVAKVVLIGIGLMIFVYSYVNIAMTIRLAPVVGVPLPFISYGGTSFFNLILLIAVVENLLARRGEFLHSYGTK
jgi:rod shape determining protein RodA